MDLRFIAGSGIRRVKIEGNVISFLSAETGFLPIKLDLDKLDSPETKKTMAKMKFEKEDKLLMEEIAKLETEEEKAQDIIKDFQKTGWRQIK